MLTTAQLQALKADILADPVLAAKPNNSDGWFDTAVAYNLIVTPTFYVWKRSVAIVELMQNGFDWTRVDNLTVGKARIWEFMTAAGIVDPSKANVRAGFEATFSVEAGDAPNRQAIYDHCQAPATRAQKLFAVGAGTASTNHGIGPATVDINFEGTLTMNDVQAARAL